MQQNKALRAAEANPKRPGSATATLDTLDLTQKKLDARITKLSKEVNHKLDGLVKMMSTVGNSRKSFGFSGDFDDDGEYYTLDADGNKVVTARRNSGDESVASGERTEYRGSSAKLRRRVESSTGSGKSNRPMSAVTTGSQASDSDAGATKVEPLNPAAKSRSLSRFAPSGILRKPSLTPDAPVSQKKRHSFSTPIATVHDITDPAASFASNAGEGAPGAGAISGGANADGPPENAAQAAALAEARADAEGSDDGSSLHTATPPRKDSMEDGSPQQDDAVAKSLSKSEDEHDADRQLREEGKQEVGSREPSFRSMDSESNTLNGSGKSKRATSPDTDVDAPIRDVNRKKPQPARVSAPPFASRKRVDVVVDRNTISGPPIELALHAMNNNRTFDRSRAYSASPHGRNSRSQSPAPESGGERGRALSAGPR